MNRKHKTTDKMTAMRRYRDNEDGMLDFVNRLVLPSVETFMSECLRRMPAKQKTGSGWDLGAIIKDREFGKSLPFMQLFDYMNDCGIIRRNDITVCDAIMSFYGSAFSSYNVAHEMEVFGAARIIDMIWVCVQHRCLTPSMECTTTQFNLFDDKDKTLAVLEFSAQSKGTYNKWSTIDIFIRKLASYSGNRNLFCETLYTFDHPFFPLGMNGKRKLRQWESRVTMHDCTYVKATKTNGR